MITVIHICHRNKTDMFSYWYFTWIGYRMYMIEISFSLSYPWEEIPPPMILWSKRDIHHCQKKPIDYDKVISLQEPETHIARSRVTEYEKCPSSLFLDPWILDERHYGISGLIHPMFPSSCWSAGWSSGWYQGRLAAFVWSGNGIWSSCPCSWPHKDCCSDTSSFAFVGLFSIWWSLIPWTLIECPLVLWLLFLDGMTIQEELPVGDITIQWLVDMLQYPPLYLDHQMFRNR